MIRRARPRVLSLVMVMALCWACTGSDSDVTTTNPEGDAATTVGAPDQSSTTGGSDEALPLTYIQQSPSMAYLPGQIAEGAGYYAEEGLAFEALAPSAESLQLVIAGDADIGTASSPQLFAAVAEDRPVVALGVLTPNSTNELVLSNDAIAALEAEGVTLESPIEDRVAALAGLTLTVPAEGTSSNLSLRSTLAEYGVDPDRDVELIPTNDPMANVTTTREGRADGYMHSPPVTSVAVAEGFGQVWFSYFQHDVPIIDGINLIQIVTTEDFLDNNPETVTRFMTALWRGHDLLVNDPDGLAEAVRPFFPDVDQAVFDVALEAMREVYRDGFAPSEEAFERTLALTASQLDTELDITYDDVYRDEIVLATQP